MSDDTPQALRRIRSVKMLLKSIQKVGALVRERTGDSPDADAFILNYIEDHLSSGDVMVGLMLGASGSRHFLADALSAEDAKIVHSAAENIEREFGGVFSKPKSRMQLWQISARKSVSNLNDAPLSRVQAVFGRSGWTFTDGVPSPNRRIQFINQMNDTVVLQSDADWDDLAFLAWCLLNELWADINELAFFSSDSRKKFNPNEAFGFRLRESLSDIKRLTSEIEGFLDALSNQ